MSKWFRRASDHPNEPGTVGLLEGDRAVTQLPSGRRASSTQMLGVRQHSGSHDTPIHDTLGNGPGTTTTDTIFMAPIRPGSPVRPATRGPLDPRLPERHPAVTRVADPRHGDSRTYDLQATDPRLDTWLPPLDRWPALRGRDEEHGPVPPGWPTPGLPAEGFPMDDCSTDRTHGRDWSADPRAWQVAPPPLPAGAMGGLPRCGTLPGGALPGSHGPQFTPNAALVEMPWRAAGGEAHPMATPTATAEGGREPLPRPDQLPLAGDPATDTSPDQGALLIFDQLIRETTRNDQPAPPDVDWASMLNAPNTETAHGDLLALPSLPTAPTHRPDWSTVNDDRTPTDTMPIACPQTTDRPGAPAITATPGPRSGSTWPPAVPVVALCLEGEHRYPAAR